MQPPTAIRRAVAYLRVSTAQQADEDRFGYHRQIEGIRTYAGSKGLSLVGEYRDAITGKSITREGLDRLISEAHGFDCVIISSVDRLARDIGASYQVLANLLASKVQVHSADHGLIDLDQETSLIQFNLQALFAHLERQKILARTRAAQFAIAAAGQIPDGMSALGYRTVKRVAEVVPSEAAIVRELFERSAAGASLVSLADWMNDQGIPRKTGKTTPWTFSDVRAIIIRTTYKGEYRWRNHTINVPPIVSPELWAKAQPKGRGRPWRKSTLKLIGHVRCALCGSRLSSYANMNATKGDRTKVYWSYRCSGGAARSCWPPRISGKHLDGLVDRLLRESLSTKRKVKELLSAAEAVVDRHDGHRAELEAEDARWLEAFRAGAITAAELSRYRAEVRQRMRALTSPDPAGGLDLDAYVRAAKTMALPDLLDLLGAEVLVQDRDSVRLVVNAYQAKIRT